MQTHILVLLCGLISVWAELRSRCAGLLEMGIQDGTKVYRAATRSFLEFCRKSGVSPLPLSAEHVLHYVTHLMDRGAAPPTVKNHISALRFNQIIAGRGTSPFDDPRILLLKRAGSLMSQPPRAAKPITLPLLRRLSHSVRLSDLRTRYAWTAMLVTFFGAFRLGEVLGPTGLRVEDVAPCPGPGMLIRLRKSKTDPMGKGTDVPIPCVADVSVCPSCLLRSLPRRSPSELLFPVTRHELLRILHELLASAGISPEEFSGHSFRSGAATSAAAAGLSPVAIQKLGSWKSSCFERYVRPSVAQSMAIAEKLQDHM